MLLKVEGFKYAISLDLNMVRYHISIINETNNLITIICVWVNYRYKSLLIEVSNSLDIFYNKLNQMFQGFYFFYK